MRKKIKILTFVFAALLIFVASELAIGPPGGPIFLDPGDGGGGISNCVYFIQGHVYKENDLAFAGKTVRITGPDGILKTATTTSDGFYARTFTYSVGGNRIFTIKVEHSGYHTKEIQVTAKESICTYNFVLRVLPTINTAINNFGLNQTLHDVDNSLALARYWEITLSNYDISEDDCFREREDYYLYLSACELYNSTSGKFKAKFSYRMDSWQHIEPGFRNDYYLLGNVKYASGNAWIPTMTTSEEFDFYVNEEELHFTVHSIYHKWMVFDWWIAEYSSQEYTTALIGVECGIVDAGLDYAETGELGRLIGSSAIIVGATIVFRTNFRDYGEPHLFETDVYFFGTGHAMAPPYCFYTKPVGSWLIAAGNPM